MAESSIKTVTIMAIENQYVKWKQISFKVVANESATKRHLTMPSNSRRRVSMRKDRSETMVAKQCELASKWPTPKQTWLATMQNVKNTF